MAQIPVVHILFLPTSNDMKLLCFYYSNDQMKCLDRVHAFCLEFVPTEWKCNKNKKITKKQHIST